MNVYTLHHICIFNDGGIFVIKIYKNILNQWKFKKSELDEWVKSGKSAMD